MSGAAPALGRYFPVDSVLHRLDPRVKLVGLLAYTISIFFVARIEVMLAALGVVPLLLILAKLPPLWLARSIRPLFFILFFTFFIHVFLTPGEAAWSLGPLTASKTGLTRGIFFSIRLILVVAVSSFITLTTTPVALTDAMESLLKPLKKVGLPVHELALMTTIALRFIPTLLDEARAVMTAQKARGADFESGGLIRRARSFIPVLVPLFVGAFRRADELALAMEARGYAGGEGRTRFHVLRLARSDYLAAALGALMIAALIGVDRYVGS